MELYIKNVFNKMRNLIQPDKKLLFDDQTLAQFKRNYRGDNKTQILENPIVFNKFILGLSKKKRITYDAVVKRKITNKHLCHIHCFKISCLDTMFGEYISLLQTYFDIIVTFSIDDGLKECCEKYNKLTILKVPNRGFDIGPRFIVHRYLDKHKYDYDYIFYIHSKTDETKRSQYMMPFIKNIETIHQALMTQKLGGFFPDMICCGTKGVLYKDFFDASVQYDEKWGRNEIYILDLLKYFNCKECKLWAEGGFFILHKTIIDKLYSDKMIYNSLNKSDSFEFNWVKHYYKIATNDIGLIYEEYKRKGYYGNNIETGLGWNGLPDAMIEHAMERLTMSVMQQCKMNIQIVSDCNNDDNCKLVEEYVNQIDIAWKNADNLSGKILLVVACHVNSEIKIKSVVNNIGYFMEISDDIIIINSSEFKYLNLDTLIKDKYSLSELYTIIYDNNLTNEQCELYKTNNVDLENMSNSELKKHWVEIGSKENARIDLRKKNINISFQYTANDKYICQGKWLKALRSININEYLFTILTNDSYLLVQSLIPYKDAFDKECEAFGICDSYQIKYHLPDYLRCYNNKGIKKICKHYVMNMHKITDFNSVIVHYEIDSTHIFDNASALFKMDKSYTGNLHFDDNLLPDYLNNKNYPVIKIKKINTVYYNDKRALPCDFNCMEYKKLHVDLINIADPIAHFLTYGVYEGRTYKKNQMFNCPGYLKPFLVKTDADVSS